MKVTQQQVARMDEHDDKLMAQYGITAETKFVFHYAGYRYERLADAVNYARICETRSGKDGASHDSDDHIG